MINQKKLNKIEGVDPVMLAIKVNEIVDYLNRHQLTAGENITLDHTGRSLIISAQWGSVGEVRENTKTVDTGTDNLRYS